MSGTGKSTKFVAATGDSRIDGLLHNRAWGDTQLTYRAPVAQSDYGPGYGSNEHLGLKQPTSLLMDAQRRYLDKQFGTAANDGFSLEGFTSLTLTESSQSNAHLRVALTTSDPFSYGTAWGYFPSLGETGGDVWLSDVTYDFSNPRVGNYSNLTMIHEIGHTLGLDHAHQSSAYGIVPAAYDAMEYTITTYRSAVGASATQYTNETWGYAQSFMMLDIAALQHIYGADFSTNSGDTVYSWLPGSGQTIVDQNIALDPGANRIFATIWDGGGIDTFDLRAYQTDLLINLRPGEASTFSTTQLAKLGNGNEASGNIYNALKYQGDQRSLIENVLGGSGKDTMTGNQVENVFDGKKGSDTLYGYDASDQLFGRWGRDKMFGGDAQDLLVGGRGNDYLKGGNSNDVLKGGENDDKLFGGRGSDTLFGGKDDDRLIGGRGGDVQTGGAGSDVFAFLDIDESAANSNWDLITDFTITEDMIDLSDLSASTFAFVGTNSFSGSGPTVRYQANASATSVYVDVSGNAANDMRIDLAGNLQLSAGDFLL